jgi:hypothetical protein
VFGPEGEEVKGYFRELHSEELHDFNSSSSISWMNKSRRLKWTGHVACMEEW